MAGMFRKLDDDPIKSFRLAAGFSPAFAAGLPNCSVPTTGGDQYHSKRWFWANRKRKFSVLPDSTYGSEGILLGLGAVFYIEVALAWSYIVSMKAGFQAKLLLLVFGLFAVGAQEATCQDQKVAVACPLLELPVNRQSRWQASTKSQNRPVHSRIQTWSFAKDFVCNGG